jgi:ABC-type transport system involved in multi-copper enzyme maturation permease subunit
MMSVLSQIAAVIRLEMKKTFFSKRGLWVYLLALAPVAITTIHSLVELTQMEQRRAFATARPVSSDVLHSIKMGMKTEEVIALAGEPHVRNQVRRRTNRSDYFQYTDGVDSYSFIFFNDKLDGINRRTRDTIQQDKVIFASIFQFFFLRLAIFFGCVGVFTNLFRGELLDRSLHYYLLTPLRREVLAVGKYLSGLIATTVIFTISTVLQLWTLSWHFDSAEISAYMNSGGWGHVLAYIGVTIAACVGYGGVFLAAGLLFKNPIIPAAAVEAWESVNLFLPAALKKVSIIFYLQSMCPIVAVPDENMNPILKLMANAAEPVSVPVAVLGLLAVTGVVLVLAARLARGLEINYSVD